MIWLVSGVIGDHAGLNDTADELGPFVDETRHLWREFLNFCECQRSRTVAR